MSDEKRGEEEAPSMNPEERPNLQNKFLKRELRTTPVKWNMLA